MLQITKILTLTMTLLCSQSFSLDIEESFELTIHENSQEVYRLLQGEWKSNCYEMTGFWDEEYLEFENNQWEFNGVTYRDENCHEPLFGFKIIAQFSMGDTVTSKNGISSNQIDIHTEKIYMTLRSQPVVDYYIYIKSLLTKSKFVMELLVALLRIVSETKQMTDS